MVQNSYLFSLEAQPMPESLCFAIAWEATYQTGVAYVIRVPRVRALSSRLWKLIGVIKANLQSRYPVRPVVPHSFIPL